MYNTVKQHEYVRKTSGVTSNAPAYAPEEVGRGRSATVWSDPDTALGWVNRTISALYQVECDLAQPNRPAPDVSQLLDMLARAKGCLEKRRDL